MKLICIALSAISLTHHALGSDTSKRPNIVVIMSDDQDKRLGSLDIQPNVQKQLIAEGLSLDNHFVTVGQCCPSRASWFRGQAAHNTNFTHVGAPGGSYAKFIASRLDEDYLPQWLAQAGYKTEYLGKLMNGITMAHYTPKIKGWSHIDVLLEPYVYSFNTVVMSKNGERPIFYEGYHQTDVIRAKALARLEYLTSQDNPFYIQIAPAAPHTEVHAGLSESPTIPLVRHKELFSNVTAPRLPNFNPVDVYQQQTSSWLRTLPYMNESTIEYTDFQHRSRIQGLQGLDEIVEDVVKFLRTKDVLENTYIIYTTDNGFHLGNHRVLGGKGLPYIEDTNIPMIIRGPGIPKGRVSKVPSTHIDMAPTFLDIAGVNAEDRPKFLDGRSLLQEWQSPSDKGIVTGGNGSPKEILNVEFWGSIANAGGPYSARYANNSYKSLRIVNNNFSWLYAVWCTSNQTDLFDTKADPYELTNLAINPTPEHARLITRLNALLLVTKSCSGDACRNPWTVLQKAANADFNSLDQAMDSSHDNFFSSMQSVGFQECLNYQSTFNEGPYFPPRSIDLQVQWREPTDDFKMLGKKNATLVGNNDIHFGSNEQRYVTEGEILKRAKELTDEEMGVTYEYVASDK